MDDAAHLDLQTRQKAPAFANEYNIEFTGQSREFFSIWIVNVMLSVITLGIYSAWAKVRTKQYFYGNTRIDGSAFEYTADPRQILKGRILAVVALVAYSVVGEIWPNLGGVAFLVLMVLLPGVIVMSLSFRMRNTRWRGIRCAFARRYKSAYRLFAPPIIYFALMVALPFVMGIDFATLANNGDQSAGRADSFGADINTYIIYVGIGVLIAALLFPWWHKNFYMFLCNHLAYGDTSFSCALQTKAFYGLYLKAFLLLFGATLVLGVATVGLIAAYGFVFGDGLAQVRWFAALAFLPMLFLMVPYGIAFAYIQAQRNNMIYGQLALGNLEVHADLETAKIFGLYFTNTLAILCSLGLAIPWAKIRTTRYKLSRITLVTQGFDALTGSQAGDRAALGEEVGEFFGLDLGF